MADDPGIKRFRPCHPYFVHRWRHGQFFATRFRGFQGIFADRSLRSELLNIYGDGSQSRDFVHVDDTVQAINIEEAQAERRYAARLACRPSNCHTHAVAALPNSVRDAEGATLPVAGLTALHALRQGGLLLGRKVLVDGAVSAADRSRPRQLMAA
jgi:NADPH:quinone reductase-like Zn-dependent oxidoreductase